MDLELGDLVLLKSGGGLCVVIDLFENDEGGSPGPYVEVAWSDGKHNYQTTYPRAALSKVSMADPAPAASGGAATTH